MMVDSRFSIICVDDEQGILDSYKEVLSKEDEPFAGILDVPTNSEQASNFLISDYNLFLASSGEEAIRIVKDEFARGNRFSAGFFDIRMPGGIDGYETIREIRKIDPEIFCAVVTAYTDRDLSTIQRLFSDTYQDHLLFFKKPFSSVELEQTALNAVCSWKRKNDEKHAKKLLDEANKQLTLEVAERRNAELETSKQNEILSAYNKLFHLYLEKLSLPDLLDSFLDIIISLPSIKIEPVGCIFLLDEKSDSMKMVSHKNLPSQVLTECSKLQIGRCICGRSASSGKVIFVNSIDQQHDVHYENMLPHGHYCVPIISSSSKILGVINLYIKEGTKHDHMIENTLSGAANILAQLIENKQANEALLKAHLDLEQKVLDRTQELQQEINERIIIEKDLAEQKKLAIQANETKSEFLANMSHEIRTPLNGIVGMTDLVLASSITSEQRNYLNLVKTSSDRLLNVINEILDFSKIEAGKLHIELIDFKFSDMLDNALKLLAVKAHEKNLELLYNIGSDVPDFLTGDPGRLRQIIINLVGNSIKFTEKGEIVVTVRREDSPAETLKKIDPQNIFITFSVKDTGIGISKDKQQAIFDPFAQADGSTTRQFGGTGLGLSISFKLIELMGGKIWLESTPGEGSTFYFTLQFTPQSQAPTHHLLAIDDLIKISVLAVDDNLTNRFILKENLKHIVKRFTSVNSGSEALKILKQETFDIILMDVMMPEMDGFETVEEIHTQHLAESAKIVMLTSAGQPGQGSTCREKMVAGYMLKPFGREELYDMIRTVLGTAINKTTDGHAADSLITRHTIREQNKKLNILLAEDEPINQLLAVTLLENEGYTVSTAENGREVLDALKKQHFDLILMDVQMPIMDGFEATAAIRTKELTGFHLPIIALTAHAIKGDREKCLSHGMDGYATKPIQLHELQREISAVMAGNINPPPSNDSSNDYSYIANKILDYDLLVTSSCAGDESLAKSLIQKFLKVSGPLWLEEMQSAVKSSDVAKIQDIANSIKEGGANVCAFEFSEAGAELGRLAANSKLSALEKAMHDLDKAFHKIEEYRKL